MRKECKANGIRISYEECGSGEPLVLLMGLGATARKWGPHIAAYEKYFHVYAPDNRGAGQSDKPVSYAYTIRDMAEDTIGMMDAAGMAMDTVQRANEIAQHNAHAQDQIIQKQDEQREGEKLYGTDEGHAAVGSPEDPSQMEKNDGNGGKKRSAACRAEQSPAEQKQQQNDQNKTD